ncbi:HigA family addiction module antitoxin [Hoeflea sp. AS16]|uniref:HigA family addiction module antitoxin n=1 Tax=unclassified Hoeflea TaxID=2614931 RepID=UPI00317FF8AA
MRLPTNRLPTHPGEMLLEEFMKPYGLSARKVATMIGVPANRISEIVAGNRSVTADTAHRLDKLFGMGVDTWLSLQAHYDAALALQQHDYSEIKLYA